MEDRLTPDGRPLPVPFIFVGAGSGAPPMARAYLAETGELAFEKQPFESTFTGGVRVAAGDIDHDGYPDLIAAAGPGAGPRVVTYSGRTGEQMEIERPSIVFHRHLKIKIMCKGNEKMKLL